MTRLITIAAVLACLAACGKDGEPLTPTGGVNVGISTNGVSASANAGLRKGPWNFLIGRSLF